MFDLMESKVSLAVDGVLRWSRLNESVYQMEREDVCVTVVELDETSFFFEVQGEFTGGQMHTLMLQSKLKTQSNTD